MGKDDIRHSCCTVFKSKVVGCVREEGGGLEEGKKVGRWSRKVLSLQVHIGPGRASGGAFN